MDPASNGSAADESALERLKGLRLPELAETRFLEVGCGDGFACGYAKLRGAARAVGIDRSAASLELARTRFPECEFAKQKGDSLPAGPFDVILVGDALHAAVDPERLIHALVQRLAEDGTLVLEAGVLNGSGSDWTSAEEPAGERRFPTLARLHEVLAPYAYKYRGPAAGPDEPRVARLVMHVRRRKPFAYLLMQPPAYGKTTIARTLFHRAGLEVVSGDSTVHRIALGRIEVSARLEALVKKEYSALSIDRTIAKVVAEGLADELVRTMFGRAKGREFALDAFLPRSTHEVAERIAREMGYVPVLLQWEPPGPRESTKTVGPEPRGETPERDKKDLEPTGVVDALRDIGDGRIRLRGWAFDETGSAPERLEVVLGGARHEVVSFRRVARPDVAERYRIADSLVGYEFELPLSDPPSLESLVAGLEVTAHSRSGARSQPLRISRRVLDGR